MKDRIYLDHNASTPIEPGVRDAMKPFLDEAYGNPSSRHWASRKAREAIAEARERVAVLIGARPDEIVLTSGGSEASNLAIKGTWFARAETAGRDRIVTTAIEHPATLEPCRFLERLGARVTRLPVDATGRAETAALADVPGDEILLLTVMHANNEVGTIQPVRELADMARKGGALVHADAAQSLGKIPVHVDDLGVDLLSIAGHKLHAPKGVGALYVRRGVTLEPLIHGAGHEAGRRSGTESALMAVALGAACELALLRVGEAGRITVLRDRLLAALREQLGDAVILQGHPTERLPNTVNVALPGVPGADVLALCPGIAASTGAACHGGGTELSDTLRAMGVDPAVGMGTIRLSLGHATTAEEIERAAVMLGEAYRRARTG